MKFHETAVAGVFEIEAEPHTDERGDFARAFCTEEFAAHGIDFTVIQANLSGNRKAGTLRGMHYQAEPVPDAKMVRCVRGRVFDVALDLRANSPSYLGWTGVELDATRRNALYVPAGCAHGFLTLEESCDVLYLRGVPYVADLARGVRWDDPAFAIEWPGEPKVIAPRDAGWPDNADSGAP